MSFINRSASRSLGTIKHLKSLGWLDRATISAPILRARSTLSAYLTTLPPCVPSTGISCPCASFALYTLNEIAVPAASSPAKPDCFSFSRQSRVSDGRAVPWSYQSQLVSCTWLQNITESYYAVFDKRVQVFHQPNAQLCTSPSDSVEAGSRKPLRQARNCQNGQHE
ncbi:hypothetical protein FA95DRAFT_97602 [Auriscalpium vulgare]|uniref:Uncharacterized protein n=1 Tax=Auriscalpium vulgare TaxID=40419 RepID=A0ACB8RQ78_9AGAM|nr:hypothetical protein FA95DRAFT_97602 [Auriscalpium vulgare]